MDVAIIGTGNLGRYHAIGAMMSQVVDDLYLYDSAQSCAENLKIELQAKPSLTKVHVLPSLNSPPVFFDLVIIASTAKKRLDLVSELFAHHRIKQLVVEKLLEQSPERIRLLVESTKSAQTVWVNHPKPMMRWHQELAAVFQAIEISEVRVSGPNWGLTTAGTHYLQLVQWWTGQKLVFASDVAGRATWFPSKRVGYWEMFGSVSFELDGGAHMHLESFPAKAPGSYAESIEIMVAGKSSTARLNEVTGEVFGLVDGCPLPSGTLDLQSNLTARLIKELAETGVCPLPIIQDVEHLHSLFTETLADTRPPQDVWSSRGLKIT